VEAKFGMAGSQSTSHSTTINHYGDIKANDPAQYRAEMDREQRLAALGAH